MFFSLGGFCSHAAKIKDIEDNGGLGAVYGQFSQVPPSWDTMAMDHTLNPQLGIGANFVGIQISNFIVGNIVAGFSNPNVSFTATITYQPDPVYEYQQTSLNLFAQCAFSICYGVAAIVALVKFALFVKEQNGLRFSVPQLCLSLTFVIAILLILQQTLNPLGGNNNTSQLTMIVFRELPNVLWIIPVLVFPFYWGELVASSQPVVGLKASRIPFFIASVIIVAMTLAVTILKGRYGSNRDVIYAQICMLTIISGLAALFFTIQGLRVIFALARMQDGFARTPVQRRTSFLVLVLALCLWGFVVSYACSFAPSIGKTYDFLWWIYSFAIYAAISLLIIAFSLSPKAIKEAGGRLSAFVSGQSGASGTESASARDIEMGSGSGKKPAQQSDEHIDAQMSGTKVAL